jgi:hypothetical protein
MHFYRVRFSRCNHNSILSETQLKTGAKSQQLNPDTMNKEDFYLCPACMNGEPGCNSINGKEDDLSALRPIANATKLSPLEIFQSGMIEKARS